MKRFLLTLILFSTLKSFACTCGYSKLSKKDYDVAKYIVTGKVMGVTLESEKRQKIISFKVQNSYKGKPDKIITISTPLSSASCGMSVRKNEEWLLFVYDFEDGNQITLCSKHLRYNRNPNQSRKSYKSNRKKLKSYLKKIKSFKHAK